MKVRMRMKAWMIKLLLRDSCNKLVKILLRKINVMHVILDLDLTLINSLEKGEKHGFNIKSTKVPDLNEYDVYERPGLQEFLDGIFVKENRVSVWTAASKDYALAIVNKFILIKPERELENIFFHYHCEISSKNFGNNSKDLRTLHKLLGIKKLPKEKLVLIDDTQAWSLGQESLVEIIQPFDLSETKEDAVLQKMLEKINKA